MAGMSHREWGEYRKRRELVKDFKEQMKGANAVGVFIIINEWVTNDGAQCSEVADMKYFETEQDAWLALRDIAHAYQDDIDYDATSITLEGHDPNLQFEEFYIQELTKESN